MCKTEGQGSEQGFFEYIEKFLEDNNTSDTSRSQVAINTGLRFALSLL